MSQSYSNFSSTCVLSTGGVILHISRKVKTARKCCACHVDHLNSSSISAGRLAVERLSLQAERHNPHCILGIGIITFPSPFSSLLAVSKALVKRITCSIWTHYFVQLGWNKVLRIPHIPRIPQLLQLLHLPHICKRCKQHHMGLQCMTEGQ